MITTEEEFKLFEECGMTEMVIKIKIEKQMKEHAEKLTAMKFKITDEKTIKKMICGKYWKPSWLFDDAMPWPILMLYGGLISMMFTAIFIVAFDLPETKFLLGGFFGGVIGMEVLMVMSWRKTAQLESMPLMLWTDPIPVGVLYAIKEAKEKGLGNFEIFYPVTERRHRIMTDPVIIGFYKKASNLETVYGIAERRLMALTNQIIPLQSVKEQMIEIFAWDDGRVYE